MWGTGTTQEPEERVIKRKGRKNPRNEEKEREGTQEPQECFFG